VKDAAFSADGKMLASVGFDSVVILWDIATAERIGLPLTGHSKVINVAAFGADETQSYLFTGSDDRTIIQWDLSTRVPPSKPINAGEPATPSLTVMSGDREAHVINEQQIKLSGRVNPLAEHTGGINSLVFSQPIDDKMLLASASDDKTVILWDVTDTAKTGVFLKLTEFNNPVLAAYFDGAKLVSTESNGFQVQWTVSPTDWVTLACAAAKRNMTLAEWSNYYPRQAHRKTCPANP
jgi:WD40 repeat protein